LLTGSLCGTDFQECSKQSLVAYYPYNNSVTDDSGNNHSSTNNGATYIDGGISGGAFYFNGTDNYIQINNSNDINNFKTKFRSVSLWFKANNTSGRQILYEEGGYLGFNIYLYNNQLYAGFFSMDDCQTKESATTNVWLVTPFSNLSAWHNVISVFDGQAEKVYLYLDGRLVASKSTKDYSNGACVYSHDRNIGVGAMVEVTKFEDLGVVDDVSSDPDYFFNGAIDELRIYNQSLSSGFASKLYAEILVPNLSSYCRDTCHNQGNSNVASCGDGIVSENEQCDDGNILDNDGCNYQCLWEGANSVWGSLCGNARVEYGEACDDGNIRDNDGCSTICLLESGTPVGSSPDAPICGNGIIEIGEDCDDGGKANGDGCSSTCVNEGSTVTCNNGIVEDGRATGFSWQFAIDESAESCADVNIYINDCPNGIWRFKANKFVQSADVKLQKEADNPISGYQCVEKEANLSFWRQAVNKIKTVVQKMLGSEAIAGDWWCTIYSATYGLSGNDYSDNFSADNADYEVIGYSDQNDSYILNFIRDTAW